MHWNIKTTTLFKVEPHLKSVGIPHTRLSIQRSYKVPKDKVDIQQIIADITKTLDELQDEVIKMQIDLHAYRLERAILKESK
jgi:restriction endonuclease S subunit